MAPLFGSPTSALSCYRSDAPAAGHAPFGQERNGCHAELHPAAGQGASGMTNATSSKGKPRRVTERPPFECIALLLQGGGALGSYQGGVYQALAEANLHPD